MRYLVVILALILAVATTLFARRANVRDLESKLTEPVAEALARDGRFSKVSVRFERLVGVMSGTVPSEQAREEAERLARRSKTAGHIVNRIEILRRDQPALLTMSFKEGEIHLEGALPSEVFRNDLVRAASAAGDVSSDLLVSDRVSFDPWQTPILEELPALFEKAKALKVAISPDGLDLEGGVKGQEAKSALLERAARLKTAKITERVAILPDLPPTLTILADGKNATLSGRLADEAAKQKIVDWVAAAGIQTQAEDLTVSKRVEPANWAALDAFLPAFSKSGVSRLTLDESGLTLSGEIKGDEAKEQLLAKARSVSDQVRDEVELAPDRPAKFTATLADGKLVLEGQLPPQNAENTAKTPKIGSGVVVEDRIERNRRVIAPKWDTDVAPFLEAFFKDAKSGVARLDGNQLVLNREIKGEAAREAMLKLAGERFAGVSLKSEITLAPDQPAQLLATLNEGKLSVTGQVAKEQTKAAVAGLQGETGIAQVDVSGLKVSPRVIAPAWSPRLAAFLKSALDGRKAGVIELDPEKLRLKRSVKGQTGKNALMAAAKAFWPEAKVIDELTVEPDKPAALAVALSGGELTLSGSIPDAATRAQLVQAVAKIQPAPKLVNQLKIDPMVIPPNWENRMAGFLSDFFSGTNAAQMKLDGAKLQLTREGLRSEEKAKLAVQAARLLPLGGEYVDEMKLAPNQPALLTAILSQGKLRITGAVPSPTLKSRIEQAAAATNFEVTGEIQVSSQIAKPAWEEGLPAFLTEFFAGAAAGELELTGQGMRLNRRVPDSKTQGKLLARANLLLPDGAGLTNQIMLPPDKPASLHVLLEDGKLRLKGWVPDEAAKNWAQKLAGNLKLKEEAIENSLRISGKIMPPTWTQGVEALWPDLFAQANEAELSVGPEGVRIRREMADPAAKVALLAKAKSLVPKDGELTDQIVIVVPRIPRLYATLADGELMIQGLVPSQEIKAAVGSAAAGAGDFEVVNALDVDTNLTMPGWEKTAAGFVGKFFAGTEAAEIDLTPKLVKMKRQVADAKAKSAFIDQAKAFLPKDAKLVDEIAVVAPPKPPAPAPKPAMVASAAKPKTEDPKAGTEAAGEKSGAGAAPKATPIPKSQMAKPAKPPNPPENAKPVEILTRTIPFKRGSTWIHPDSVKLIGEAGKAALEESGTRIIITGYADSTGDSEANAIVSEMRAKEVRKHLLRQGLDSSRLELMGLGDKSGGGRRVVLSVIK